MNLATDDEKCERTPDTFDTSNPRDSVHPRRTEWLVIKSINEFNQILKRHPYLRAHKNFSRRYQRVIKYFHLQRILSENESLSLTAAARELGIPYPTAYYWKQGHLPILMKILLDNERVLCSKEASMTSEYKSHYVPSYDVYNLFKTVKPKERNIKIFSKIIEIISNSSQNQLCIVELVPYNTGHRKEMQQVVRYIAKKRKQIENILENQSSSSKTIRVGVLDDKLFIWSQRTTKKHFHYLANELFFFDKKKRAYLIRKTEQHLGGIGAVKLSNLVRQMTGYSFSKRFPTDSINADLKHEKLYLSGRTLHFVLDVLSINLDRCIQHVKRIGRGNQIKRPKILTNPEFYDLMTRLFAIIGSDGHVQRKIDRVQYSERNEQRRERVIQLLKRLGDIKIKPQKINGKIIRLNLPPVLGRILVALGMPAGDKVLQGYNLPDFIMRGTFSSRCGYFEEVLPEEACISIRKNGIGYVILGRRVILQDPSKSKVYGISSKIIQNHIDLIQKKGREESKSYGSEVIIEVSMVLSRYKLRLQKKNHGNVRAANQFLKIINDNPPQLLIDERRLLRSLGIKSSLSWKVVSLYESGRVSVLWEIRTKSQLDTALWGVLAPPNDVVKREKFERWLKNNNALVKQIESKHKKTQL
jgi:hypothetical protein